MLSEETRYICDLFKALPSEIRTPQFYILYYLRRRKNVMKIYLYATLVLRLFLHTILALTPFPKMCELCFKTPHAASVLWERHANFIEKINSAIKISTL